MKLRAVGYQLARQVGAGGLAIAAACLNTYVDATTGAVRQEISPRELPGLVKSSIEALSVAHGASTEAAHPSATLEEALRSTPEDTRRQVVLGLRALSEWYEATQGRRR